MKRRDARKIPGSSQVFTKMSPTRPQHHDSAEKSSVLENLVKTLFDSEWVLEL